MTCAKCNQKIGIGNIPTETTGECDHGLGSHVKDYETVRWDEYERGKDNMGEYWKGLCLEIMEDPGVKVGINWKGMPMDLFELTNKESDILQQKGKEYTVGSTDRLANFKRLAEQLNLTKEQVWAVYFQKHIDSIMNYIQEGKTFSEESIEGRIMDARNYLYLFYLMVKENRE